MNTAYPLPWCKSLDVPYWRLNLFLCWVREGWRTYQKHKSIDELIPEMDTLIPEYLDLMQYLGVLSADISLPATAISDNQVN